MNEIIWPPPETPLLPQQVWDVSSARTLPAVARAVQLYAGLISQCPMDDYRGEQLLPRPRMLEQPDPEMARSTYVSMAVQEFLLHGNTASVVVGRDAFGWPAAAQWFPAEQWMITEDVRTGQVAHWLNGRLVPNVDVIHVPRGADPNMPRRGIGVIDEHLRTLNRMGMQETSESETLRGAGVPSVAVIAPQKNPTQAEMDAAGQAWEDRFSTTGGRRPAILPNGTQVIPLAWSPTDQQAQAARQMSLTDTANIFNLDAYWLNAPASSHTYRSPGPMYLSLMRTSLEAVFGPFEDVWSGRWLPRGRRVTFDRLKLLREDMATTVKTMQAAVTAGLMSVAEARAYMGLPETAEGLLPPGGTQPETEPELEEPEPRPQLEAVP